MVAAAQLSFYVFPDGDERIAEGREIGTHPGQITRSCAGAIEIGKRAGNAGMHTGQIADLLQFPAVQSQNGVFHHQVEVCVRHDGHAGRKLLRKTREGGDAFGRENRAVPRQFVAQMFRESGGGDKQADSGFLRVQGFPEFTQDQRSLPRAGGASK